MNTAVHKSPCRAPGARAAFTLVELLVVIAVIGILVGITLPLSRYAIYRSRMARREVMREQIKAALDEYRAVYGEYPITPKDSMSPAYLDDVKRHYASIATECASTSNSPFTNVNLTTNTLEIMAHAEGTSYVDYALTYPLMLRPLSEGKKPFFIFPDVTVLTLIFRRWDKDEVKTIVRRRNISVEVWRQRGNAINRPVATDPFSAKQWKYECEDGQSFTLTNWTSI